MSVKNDIEAGNTASAPKNSNEITSSSVKYSIVLGIFIVINHELAYVLHREQGNDESLKLSRTDAFIITFIMGLVNALFYWTQKYRMLIVVDGAEIALNHSSWHFV